MRSTRRTLLAAALASALVALPTAASAAERPDHAGQRDASAATEDSDTNDGTRNNVVDDGDNAHPSGKDRSTENGGSGNQGKAQADPDDDGRGPDRTNGGADQPDGPGGDDLADQDGNNGCGNDDDFEDDNEGQCGKPEGEPRTTAADADNGTGSTDDTATKGGKATGGSTTDANEDTDAVTTVSATCPATSVLVTSTKDLSNVVLVFVDGDHERFEGLAGHSDRFAGTGANAGDEIVRVYVKSGDNASGEGPGYGERHDVVCSTSTGTGPTDLTTTDATGDDATGGDTLAVSDQAGERPATGRPAPEGVPTAAVVTEVLGVVLERPAAPAAAPEVLAGLDVLAAGTAIAAAPGLAGDALPRTGSHTGRAALVALLSVLGGAVAVRRAA